MARGTGPAEVGRVSGDGGLNNRISVRASLLLLFGEQVGVVSCGRDAIWGSRTRTERRISSSGSPVSLGCRVERVQKGLWIMPSGRLALLIIYELQELYY